MVFLTEVHRVEHEGHVLAAEGRKSHLNDGGTSNGDDDEDDGDDNEDVDKDDDDLLHHAVQHGVESEVRSQVSGQQGHCVGRELAKRIHLQPGFIQGRIMICLFELFGFVLIHFPICLVA